MARVHRGKRRHKRHNQQNVLVKWIMLFALSLAFYLLWYLLDGIIMTEDAPSYINMQADREPGYCLYLWAFRSLLGKEVYLHAAVIGQCILAAVAACDVTLGLTRLFSLDALGSAGILAVQYGITLLNRFVAKRRCSYFNSIETEGLAYTFWVFYFLCILGIIYKKDKKSVVGAVFWSLVLVSIRKQMMITFVILFVVMVCVYTKEAGWKVAWAFALIACVLGFSGTKLADCTYNLAFRGTFAPHTGDATFILGTQLYLADMEMVDNINGERNKALFTEIMVRADEKEYNVKYAGSGWQALEDHYSLAYDRIKFDTLMVVVREKQKAEGIDEADREADYERTVKAMMKELFVPTLPRLIELYFCNVIHGFITTVLKVHRLLNPAAAAIYILYMAAALYFFISRDRYPAGKSCNPLYFAAVVMLSIAVNVCFTSLTIYCQMRYMLYNTGLFYQVWVVMFMEMLGGHSNARRA